MTARELVADRGTSQVSWYPVTSRPSLLPFLVALSACSDAVAPPSPVHLDPPHALQVASGFDHTCVLTPQATLICWGAASAAGGGTRGETVGPRYVDAPSFVAVSGAGSYTCGLTAEGRVFCWGSNTFGELGDGTRTDRPLPTPVETRLRFVEISGGANSVCALTANGQAYCWGRGDQGELGDGMDGTGHVALVPTAVRSQVRFTYISVGGGRACAIARDGRAYCWGVTGAEVLTGATPQAAYQDSIANNCGSTYDGTALHCALPTLIDGEHRFRSLATGEISACGIDVQDLTYCWGEGQWGTLGNGTAGRSPPARTPVAVTTDRTFGALTAGATFMCALTSQGAAYCWGNNFRGTLGIGERPGSAVPVPVVGGLRFLSLDSGPIHTCGVTADQAIYCWGINEYGQLGRVGIDQSPVPIRVDLPLP